MKRSSTEICAEFGAKGCHCEVETKGLSYRAGGMIFIHLPGVEKSRKKLAATGINFKKLELIGFDDTGYDGRGRYYDCYAVTAGDYVSCTVAQYGNCAKEKKISFCTGRDSFEYYAQKDELKINGLNDLSGVFAELGL